MANNRMMLGCRTCLANPEIPFEKSVVYMAKYYPDTGWYVSGVNWANWGKQFGRFLEEHQHVKDSLGIHFQLVYENDTPFGRSKDKIIAMLDALTDNAHAAQS